VRKPPATPSRDFDVIPYALPQVGYDSALAMFSWKVAVTGADRHAAGSEVEAKAELGQSWTKRLVVHTEIGRTENRLCSRIRIPIGVVQQIEDFQGELSAAGAPQRQFLRGAEVPHEIRRLMMREPGQ